MRKRMRLESDLIGNEKNDLTGNEIGTRGRRGGE